jgi:hypothetical protein
MRATVLPEAASPSWSYTAEDADGRRTRGGAGVEPAGRPVGSDGQLVAVGDVPPRAGQDPLAVDRGDRDEPNGDPEPGAVGIDRA